MTKKQGTKRKREPERCKNEATLINYIKKNHLENEQFYWENGQIWRNLCPKKKKPITRCSLLPQHLGGIKHKFRKKNRKRTTI